MEVNVSLETGGSSSSKQLVRGKDGRWRDVFGKFARKKTSSVQTNTDVVDEVLPEVMPEAEIVSESSIVGVVITPSRTYQRIGYAVLSFIRFGAWSLGVVGGTYAVLRLCRCSLVFDDAFEIIINRQ